MRFYISLLIACLLLPFDNLMSQNLSGEQINFLKNNAENITNYASPNAKVFDPLKVAIGDKRFVLLGEFNHGSKEVFLLRNAFIKYLNQQLEFEVILFESGIGELLYPEFYKKERTPTQMTYGFFGGWRTKEFAELMNYVKTKEMSVAGFDVQRTGRSFAIILQGIATLAKLDTTSYAQLENRFSTLKGRLSNRKIPYTDSIAQRTHSLMDDYAFLYSKLMNTEETIPFKMNLLTLKTIQNRIAYLDYMLQFKEDQNWNKRWAARDALMAENVIWLAENLYPNQKIIIVGHNFHISKYNEKEAVMGEFLLEKYPDEMYSIGVYAKAGKFLGNYGNTKEMLPADKESLDIKHIIGALKQEVSFLPFPKESTLGTEWLRDRIITNDTFVDLSNSNTIILSKNYDGLFLLQNISIPDK